MLEGLVAWVLNNYLGKYVENLNTDQLSIAILSGEVELENLPLRRDALRHLGIPIEIRAGHIGKVKLQIPIRSLRSAPWVIVIERLYLVAGPLALDEWDQAAEELAEQERKLAALDALEACWRVEADAGGAADGSYYASSYTSWLNYGTGLITDIVENMQLRIMDVHVRYEDGSSLAGGAACAVGLTVESLSAQSCDAAWTPHFTTHRDATGLSYKTIELRALAVYWDAVDAAQLSARLPAAEAQGAATAAQHRYLVAPVSACARLQRNRSELPLRSAATPRFVCDLRLDEVPLTLRDWQYEQMVGCVRGLEFLARVQQQRRRRPAVSVSVDPRAWWQYAAGAHVAGAVRRAASWAECGERARQNVRYVELYARLLAQPAAALGAEARRLKDAVEWARGLQELRALREVAMRRVPCPGAPPAAAAARPGESSGRSVLVRWFPQWWGWYSAPAPGTEPTATATTTATTTGNHQLEDEILEALADSARNNTLLRRDVVFGKVNFALNSGTLHLCAGAGAGGDEGVPMLELQFSELLVGVEARPRSSAHGVTLSLGGLCLRDRLTPGTLFPVLVGPPGRERAAPRGRPAWGSPRPPPDDEPAAPLFRLAYEAAGAASRRLHVLSQPLDVVYQPAAVRWLVEFVCAPHQRSAARHRFEAMRARTKQELMDTWGSMLEGREPPGAGSRAAWDLRLDVSAPQLILVERFCDAAAAIAVIDLGTLRLENAGQLSQGQLLVQTGVQQAAQVSPDDEEDDDAFMTPCSTPPGSEAGDGEAAAGGAALSEVSLHRRLYDTYSVELSDIQVLVGRARDNWRHAHTKGSSALHVLDRFNIALRVERRVVPTADPMFPSLTLAANLPRLVAHLNEPKLAAVRTLARVITDASLPSPFGAAPEPAPERAAPPPQPPPAARASPDAAAEPGRLLTAQFTVDHVSLEVQSRGRSVAELQVSGVSAALTRRSCDLGLSLSVHGLLLVDALQTYGPDFELLVASHRHVGMDSMSGSLRDSEPTSPTSPGSPDPAAAARHRATSPVALSRALSGLAVSPPPPHPAAASAWHDAEALISVELLLVSGPEEPLQLACIQFNNLDIIANQETIVELVGFVRRVVPPTRGSSKPPPPQPADEPDAPRARVPAPRGRTELTFDFHRLSVLLVRGGAAEGRAAGRKVGTATMCGARIQATLAGAALVVRGSLGGLQVLDLTPAGHAHQRIVSVGRDPLAEERAPPDPPPAAGDSDEDTAFSFEVRRALHPHVDADDDAAGVEVSVRMASVWYTHAPAFLAELQSCAAEFKQYLADVARSLRSAATDVALGLVHARAEALAGDVASPRRPRRRSTSVSESHTPYSPPDDDDIAFDAADTRVDVVLDSPVLVLPRSADSWHVLVAHLGKITVGNTATAPGTYAVEVRDMNVRTLNTGPRRAGGATLQRADQLYGCDGAEPILHDTLLRLAVSRSAPPSPGPGVLLEGDGDEAAGGLLEVRGCVVSALRVSLSRAQYEQLLDTAHWLGGAGAGPPPPPAGRALPEIAEEVAGGVSTLSMDPHVRAKLFPSAAPEKLNTTTHMRLAVHFEVAAFEAELRGEAGLVGLSFSELAVAAARPRPHETEVRVSLRALLVEDLRAAADSARRRMVATREPPEAPRRPPGVSRSCPAGWTRPPSTTLHPHGSLPDRLDTRRVFGLPDTTPQLPTPQPPAPPPPPPAETEAEAEDCLPGLVVVTSHLVDPASPDFATAHNSMRRRTSVHLGHLDVVLCAASWTPLLDFFSVNSDDSDEETDNNVHKQNGDTEVEKVGDSATTVHVSALTLAAVRGGAGPAVAQARVQGARVSVERAGRRRRVLGRLGALRVRAGAPGEACAGERLATLGGGAALHWQYARPPALPAAVAAAADSELQLQAAPFVYVHSKRFIAQLRAFFNDFNTSDNTPRKQTNNKKKQPQQQGSRVWVCARAEAGSLLVPVRAGSGDLLALDLGRLAVDNAFKGPLDVQTWTLHDVDLYAGQALPWGAEPPPSALVFGECAVVRRGGSLLADKCRLEICVERNLAGAACRTDAPDMTVSCCLSTLEAALDVREYALVRGVLAHNLGEDTEHIVASAPAAAGDHDGGDVWTLSSVRVQLHDVRVRLRGLACVHLARSRLTVDSFSDLSQDVDLVAREVLVLDERAGRAPHAFTTAVLRPARTAAPGAVQAELHSRRRRDQARFTVLLNNMRVLAVPGWWRAAARFIFAQHEPPPPPPQPPSAASEQPPFELKLNITDSEIVVVEDTASADTNAVILRSTTLMTYRPGAEGDVKPLSCSVNHLEVFSCAVRGAEALADEDTALSIVDPVTAGAEVVRRGAAAVLDVQLHELTVRVSYRDVLMFAAMLEAFGRQTQSAAAPAESDAVGKLRALGFAAADCERALAACAGRLDDAALWLTQHADAARPSPSATPTAAAGSSALDIRSVELRAACVRLCLIDDCGDVDVPLAEATLSEVCATYELGGEGAVDPAGAADGEEGSEARRGATLACTLALDYYNRVLGGWEPCVEAWRGRAVVRREDGPAGRRRLALHSDHVLDVTVTDALLALVRLVHAAWARDAAAAPRTAPRQPFVPYSLRNLTGAPLHFATVVTEPDQPFRLALGDATDLEQREQDELLANVTWIAVDAGETVPFSYGSGRAKQRHKESHRLRAHQLCVRAQGWRAAPPVTVDRVGVYFRHARALTTGGGRPARLVFDVQLDGAARKLVTVRSALLLVNRLPDAVDVKLVERGAALAVDAVSAASRTTVLAPGAALPVPLALAHSHVFVRPAEPRDAHAYCRPEVPWARAQRPGERALSALACTTHRGATYHLCSAVRRERFPPGAAHPAHTVHLLPALLIANLLPQELHYVVSLVPEDGDCGGNTVVARGRIAAGRSAAVAAADPGALLDVAVHVDGFRCVSGVQVCGGALEAAEGGELAARVLLEDAQRRRLALAARAEAGRGARLRLSVTAPYWIVNRTGLPLVFRQEGVAADAAGQHDEHEVARMVAPLLFSFTDQDASPTVVARVGNRHASTGERGGAPLWCQQFHVRRGVQVRRLRVSGAPDTVFVVGVEVRGARGRARQPHTTVVTVSPRHQLHNRSARALEFAQACHAGSVADPGARAARVAAPPGCHVPFHWPRLDRDQLLCVRAEAGDTTTAWSGGLRIDAPLSCHVMLRDAATGARALFLHAEVVPHGATHCVVLSDADALPPPLRVDNCADVAVTFAQAGTGAASVAHARRAVPYAWDEPAGQMRLAVTAPGGASALYHIDHLGRGAQLTYENFIYVAFTGTFDTEDDLDHYDEDDYSVPMVRGPRRRVQLRRTDPVRSQRLVLDVAADGLHVVLAGKQPGRRAQLWRMTSTGQLQHEGSGGARPLVLDIEAPAPQPSAPRPARLALRRPDPRRRTTQTWRFAADGRLCCAHRNTCVQAADGLLGLRPGAPAVLGATSAAPPHRAPLEQLVGKQRMRPGSGLLSVEVATDGPTRVLRVTDMKQRDPLAARALPDPADWAGISSAHWPALDALSPAGGPQPELQVTVMLRAGLGVSVVGGGRELLYLQLNNIIAEAVVGARSRELNVSVQDAQCDNQLAAAGGECGVALHAARARSADEARRAHALPVLELRAEMQPTAGAVVIFKHFIVCVRPVAVHLEETLLLRMYEFLLAASGEAPPEDDEDSTVATAYDDDDAVNDEEEEESVTGAAAGPAAAAAGAVRYHFGIIRLVPGPVRLSVHTAAAGALPARLRALKRRLGLTLVGFEDAPVELEPYVRHHPFETGARLRRSVLGHFREVLLWQAAIILGSVDFLGSPLGLLGDVSEGVSGLIRDRSVGALVLNVAHGLSNSAAKVTETLGDGLGRVAMDDAHEEMRQRLRRKQAGSGGEHLVAGIKGLGFGLLGGATGIFKQVYEGAAADGLPGAFAGLGKGLVGAVAKPVVGVLDLATETARAVRDSSRGAARATPERRRPPRAAPGPGGLLAPYRARDARGQAHLRALHAATDERYVAYECVRGGADALRVLISSERVRVVAGGGGGEGAPTTVAETSLAELAACAPLTQDGRHYLEMVVRGAGPERRPLVRCDTEDLARAVCRQLNYAKRLHEEAAHTLHTHDD